MEMFKYNTEVLNVPNEHLQSFIDDNKKTYAELIKKLGADAVKYKAMTLEEFNNFDITNMVYSPNHCCIWNSPNDIDRNCIILSCNESFAIVHFLNEQFSDPNLPRELYRIEDLLPVGKLK